MVSKDLPKLRTDHKKVSTFRIITQKDLSIENLVLIFKKNRSERTAFDIYILSRTLEETDLIKKFKLDKIDQKNIDTILSFVCLNLNHLHFPKEKILFKKGDKADKFFVILKGKIQILKTKFNKIKLSTKEYYQYLIQLEKDNETDLLDDMIEKNKQCFPLSNKTELAFILDKIFKLEIKFDLENSKGFYEIKKKIESNGKSLEEFEINFPEIDALSKKGEIDTISRIQLKVLNNLKHDPELKIFSHIDDPHERKSVFIPERFLFMTKKTGEYFGEFAMHSDNNLRTATILVEEDSHLLYISAEIYHNFIFKEKQKIKQKEICFLIDNFFFESVSYAVFNKHFYNHFFSVTPNRGEIIFKQGSVFDRICFIMNGEVEISIKTTLEQLFHLITLLKSKLRNNQKKRENDISDNNLILDITNPEIKTKKNFKIVVASSKEILGIEESLFGFNMMFTSTMISDESRILILNSIDLERILLSESKCQKSYEDRVYLKLVSTINRLTSVFENYSKIREANQKLNFTCEKLNEYSYFENRPSINFSVLINPRIYKEKIIKNLKKTDQIKLNISSIESTFERFSNIKNIPRTDRQIKLVKNYSLKKSESSVKKNDVYDSEINKLKKQLKMVETSRNFIETINNKSSLIEENTFYKSVINKNKKIIKFDERLKDSILSRISPNFTIDTRKIIGFSEPKSKSEMREDIKKRILKLESENSLRIFKETNKNNIIQVKELKNKIKLKKNIKFL